MAPWFRCRTSPQVQRTTGPVTINQTGQLVSTTVSFNLPAGEALGDATAAIDQIKKDINMPADVFTSYGGTAQIFQQSQGNTPLLILAAVLTIYVVLGVLYESFIHPLTILSGLPAAALGALLALKVMGFDLSIIALIGLLMLIGIVKKNAIMMIDVALENLRSGTGCHPPKRSTKPACRRFRPIMMTTFCALLGALPIALGTGASSELRQPLGIAVVGGLIVSQALTLFITPVIFVEMGRLSDWLLSFGRKKKPRKKKRFPGRSPPSDPTGADGARFIFNRRLEQRPTSVASRALFEFGRRPAPRRSSCSSSQITICNKRCGHGSGAGFRLWHDEHGAGHGGRRDDAFHGFHQRGRHCRQHAHRALLHEGSANSARPP